MNAQELIDAVNKAKLCTPHDAGDEIEGLDYPEVSTVDLDEHRWYVLGTIVYNVNGTIVGVRGPVALKSESMGFEDIGYECEAFEMEAVPSVTYKRKRKGA